MSSVRRGPWELGNAEGPPCKGWWFYASTGPLEPSFNKTWRPGEIELQL